MTSEQQNRIEQFYLEMYDLLFLYGCNALDSESLAEEAIQEAFRVVCMKPEELLDSPNPKGWILNTLKYTIQNIRRSREKASAVVNEYLTIYTGEAAVAKDQVPLELTYQDVARSEEFQLIWELAVEGKSHLEMARTRGISVAACKKRVQRAKEFLRRKI